MKKPANGGLPGRARLNHPPDRRAG